MVAPASSARSAAAMPRAGRIPAKARLHVVTGKGGTGKTTVAAALALGARRRRPQGAARRGRGTAGAGPAVRRPALPYARAATRDRRRRRRGLRPGHRPRSRRMLEYLEMFYGLKRSGAGAAAGWARSTSSPRSRPDCATCCSPARSRSRSTRTDHERPTDLRRRRARRAAHRPDPPVPRRHPGGRQPDQGRPDQPAERPASSSCCTARAPPSTSSRCSRRCRSRRRSTPRAELARRRLPLGAVIVNRARPTLVGRAAGRRRTAGRPHARSPRA